LKGRLKLKKKMGKALRKRTPEYYVRKKIGILMRSRIKYYTLKRKKVKKIDKKKLIKITAFKSSRIGNISNFLNENQKIEVLRYYRGNFLNQTVMLKKLPTHYITLDSGKLRVNNNIKLVSWNKWKEGFSANIFKMKIILFKYICAFRKMPMETYLSQKDVNKNFIFKVQIFLKILTNFLIKLWVFIMLNNFEYKPKLKRLSKWKKKKIFKFKINGAKWYQRKLFQKKRNKRGYVFLKKFTRRIHQRLRHLTNLRRIRKYYLWKSFKKEKALIVKWGILNIKRLSKLIAFINLVVKRKEETNLYLSLLSKIGIYKFEKTNLIYENLRTQISIRDVLQNNINENMWISRCICFTTSGRLMYKNYIISKELVLESGRIKKYKRIDDTLLIFSSSLDIFVKKK
jgi:hypothetical protein